MQKNRVVRYQRDSQSSYKRKTQQIDNNMMKRMQKTTVRRTSLYPKLHIKKKTALNCIHNKLILKCCGFFT